MTNSPNYNFSLYSSSDTGVTFLNYRISISGEQNTSNFMIIDTVLNEHQEAIQTLQDSPSVWGVNAQYNSENFYVAGVVGYPGYQNNQIIALSLNQNNIGTVTISINSASTVSVMKYNSNGSLVNMENNDFIANNPVLCLYNGTVFIAIGVLNADTVNISGTAGNVVTITEDNTLGDSGYGIGEANGVATLDENGNVEQNANTSTTANSVSNALVINLNNQTQQSYNGSKEVQVDFTPENIGALPENGNAATATKLQTAVNIGNASFDGSGDISLQQIGVGFSTATITPGSGYGSSLSRVSASSVYVDVYINLTKNGNPAYYETICTLPENARPQFQFVCPAVFRNPLNGATQFAVAELNTNGLVKLNCTAPDPSLGLTQIIIKTGFALI